MAAILLLEVNRDNLELFRRILETSGHTILTATTAEEALQVSANASQAIDMLVADVVLNGFKSGISAAEKILDERPSLHVLLISGYPLEMVLEETFKSHRIFFLQKPFAAQTFRDKLMEVLNSAKNARASGQTLP